jgi:TolA-binding protein
VSFFSIRYALAASGAIAALLVTHAAPPGAGRVDDAAVALTPTDHPPVARDASQLWMAPSAADRTNAATHPALAQLQAALRLYGDEKYEQALTRFLAAATPKSPLQAHAAYYAGVSELRLGRFDAAR